LKKPGIFDPLINTPGEKRPASRGRVLFWASIALAILFLYLALRELDWGAFFSTLRKARYALLPLMLIWGSLSLFVRSARWRVLLDREKNIPLPNVFLANSAGYLGNNILPARAGELVRAVYLGNRNNIAASFALATGLVERIMDLIALIIIGALSLASAGVLSGPLQTGLLSMSALGGIGLASIFILPYLNRWMTRLINHFPININLKRKLGGYLDQFLDGLKSLRSLTRAAQFLFYTCIVWLMDGLGMVFIAFILNLTLAIQQAFVLLAAMGLSSAIPSTPGYVGVYQFAAVLALGPFGFSKADAVALVLFAQISNFLVILFWGLIAMGRFAKGKSVTAESKG